MDNPKPSRTMDQAYWDAVSADYDSEIFSVLDNDTGGLIAGHIARLGGGELIAADLGCGTGKFTPLLARAFGRVHACDLSANLLARARHVCRDFDNVDFLQTDLGRVAHPFDPVDFVLCVNVLIMAGLDARMGALRAVTAQVKSGGHLLLVTPSTESMLYTQFRRIDWCLREGMDCDVAIRDSVPVRGSVRDLHQGIRPIDGMPTKHHLREELLVLLRGHEMEILSIEKLTYPWTTEFRDPPSWMEGPHPWDWLVLARRK